MRSSSAFSVQREKGPRLKRLPYWVAYLLLAYALISQPAFQTIAGGVAIFLFGMLFIEEGFEALSGGVLQSFLRKSTNRIAKSQALGFLTTAVMQSSSLVTVITISALSAGLITLASGIGIVFGANLGTTTGAWLMAGFGMKVDIAAYAMPVIVLGIVLRFQSKAVIRSVGNVLAGIGFVFLGIAFMKDGFSTFSSSFDLSHYAVGGIAGLFTYTVIGIAVTVVMQSSHATLLLTIAALAAGQVTYDNALALAIGSNVGTTITALIGGMGADVQGRRLAYAHVVFNLVTGAIALILIEPIKWSVDAVAQNVGIAADDWTLKLAIFHTEFNVLGILVMTPLLGTLVRQLEKRVKPGAAATERDVILEPIYLNEAALALPDAAIHVLRRETRHLFDNVFEVVAHGLNLHRKDIRSSRRMEEVVAASVEIMEIDVMAKYYESIKGLNNAIVDFATRAPAVASMSNQQMTSVHNIRLACRDAAEIVKTISEMRPNVNRYMKSKNDAAREQYNLIRQNIGQVLRELYALRDEVDVYQVTSALEALRGRLRELDVLANGTLDRLVREKAIDSTIATSLMNDSAGAYTVGSNLIEIAEHTSAATRPARRDSMQEEISPALSE